VGARYASKLQASFLLYGMRPSCCNGRVIFSPREHGPGDSGQSSMRRKVPALAIGAPSLGGRGRLTGPPSFRKAAKGPLVDGVQPIIIADYGSSQGRNSMTPMRIAVRSLRRRVGSYRPIFVFHVDLPSNDFTVPARSCRGVSVAHRGWDEFAYCLT
jgi:hypothetical protein